jgi:hypothetical protein
MNYQSTCQEELPRYTNGTLELTNLPSHGSACSGAKPEAASIQLGVPGILHPFHG